MDQRGRGKEEAVTVVRVGEVNWKPDVEEELKPNLPPQTEVYLQVQLLPGKHRRDQTTPGQPAE